MLAASVDDEQVNQVPTYCVSVTLTANALNSQAETELSEIKSQAKMIFRRMSPNSAPQASIESGQYNLQYVYSVSE